MSGPREVRPGGRVSTRALDEMLQQEPSALLDSIRGVVPEELRSGRSLSDWIDVPSLVAMGLRIVGAVAVATLLYWALKLVLGRVERSIGGTPGAVGTLHEQRARTLVGLLRSIGRVVIAVMLLFMVLGAVGVNLGPLLAGAGVVGLAVSFGAQSLVKDVISGLFILFENQFAVGDVVQVEGVSGSVERMTLRVVVLRDVYGAVHIVPNGQITKVTNLTRSWARAVVDVGIAYKEDPDHVIDVLRGVGKELYEDERWRPLLLDAVEVPGVEGIADGMVKVRVMVKTLPLKQWEVGRELRRRIKIRLEREGIETPTTTQTLLYGGPAPLSEPPPKKAPELPEAE